jgi:glycosyltransferase involved in cell wall biosynthesis
MLGKLPKVSVIMPIFNEEKWISQSLESIQKQTYKNIEIIIVDDFSTDNSIKIIERYVKSDNRIKLIKKCDEPRGPGVSRNIAFKIADGEYIAFQDADDYSEPERIKRQLEKALENPAKRMVGCNLKIIKNDSIISKKFPENHNEIIKGFSKFFGRGSYFVMGTALGPKSFFLKNPCKEEIRYVTDWDQLLRIYENEDVEFYNVQEMLYHYNHIGGLSSAKKGWIESNLFVRFSQRMRKKTKHDPLTKNELSIYLRKNPSELILFRILQGFYFLRTKLGI